MRCDKIRELLAADYIDGELDPGTMGLVEAHLVSCASCKAFESAVRQAAVAPLRARRT